MKIKKLPAALYRYEIQQLAKKEKVETIVEIGVYAGDLSRLLFPIKTLKILFMIDPWKEYINYKNDPIVSQKDADLLYESVKCWTELSTIKDKVRLMRMTSVEAAKQIYNNSIDFVHIDGNHEYESVKIDIKTWLPKLKPGKLLTGDDYHADCVKSAVDGLLSPVKSIGNKIWYYRKPI